MATQYGTNGNDTLQAGSGGDTIVGYEGNDFINGSASADLIYGNQDSDTVVAGDGADIVVGGKGNDFLLGNMGNDFILGNENNDTIYGGMGDDTIVGGKDDDRLAGNEGSNLIYGNEGTDTAFGYGNASGYTYARDGAGVVYIRNAATGATDTLIEIESVEFADGTRSIADLFPTPPAPIDNDFTFNGRLPTTDTKPNGDFLSGAGTPGTNFEGVTNHNSHVHIFKAETYRTASPAITPVSSTQDGVTITNEYRYAAGTQSTANGSDSNRADRAATVDNFDIGTDDGTTLAQFLSGGGRFERSYDTDPTATVNAVTAEARIDAAGNGVDWFVKGTNTPFQTDDVGDGDTSANSFSRSFLGVPAASLYSGAQFTDSISAYDASGRLLASIVDYETLV